MIVSVLSSSALSGVSGGVPSSPEPRLRVRPLPLPPPPPFPPLRELLLLKGLIAPFCSDERFFCVMICGECRTRGREELRGEERGEGERKP